MHYILLLLSLMFTAGCVGPVKLLYPPKAGEPSRTVYVVNHGGLHTGMAVSWADIPTNLWPARLDYPEARFLEVGWGDDDGYRKPLTCWIAFKALVWSSGSVLQLDGFTNSIAENFDDPGYTIIEIQLSERGFERLCEHISQTHALDDKGQIVRLGDDWYRAQRHYWLFNTCNTWVASGLRKAGCPITPFYCVTRGPLLDQTGKFGRVLQEGRPTDAPKAK